jgi:hypothetical protein
MQISGDVCRFEHFIDTLARFPEMTGRKINVIGVYIGWRGRDLTVPGLSLFGFWSRKSAGQIVASQNGCLAAISELALAARAPDKTIIIACSLAIRLADWYWGTPSPIPFSFFSLHHTPPANPIC